MKKNLPINAGDRLSWVGERSRRSPLRIFTLPGAPWKALVALRCGKSRIFGGISLWPVHIFLVNLKKFIFWCWHASIYRCPLTSSWLLVLSSVVLTDFLPVGFCLFLKGGVEVSIQTSGFICFFLQLSLCYVFRCSVVRCKFLSSWRTDPLSLCIASF